MMIGKICKVPFWASTLVLFALSGFGLSAGSSTEQKAQAPSKVIQSTATIFTLPTSKTEGDSGHKAAPESVIGLAKNRRIEGRLVTIDLYIENLGTEALENVTVTDDLDTAFGAGNYTVLSVDYVSGPGTLTINPNYDGSSDTLVVSDGTLDIEGLTHIAVQIEFSVSGGTYTNQASASASNISGGATTD